MAKASQEEVEKTAKRLAEMETPPVKEPEAKTEEAKAEEPKKEPPKEQKTETAEKPVETPVADSEEPVPEDPKEAGRAFAQMRNRIKELEEQVTASKGAAEEVAPPMPQIESPPPAQGFGQQTDINQFYNAETGEFDAARFQQSVQDTATRQASEIAKQQIEEFKQTQEAVTTYPNLDPKSKDFDREFYQAVRGKLLDSMLRPNEYGNKPLTYKEAADKIIGLSDKARKELKDKGAEAAMEELATKEAASLEAAGSSGRAASTEASGEAEFLSDETRKGGKEGAQAVARRLEKLGI